MKVKTDQEGEDVVVEWEEEVQEEVLEGFKIHYIYSDCF